VVLGHFRELQLNDEEIFDLLGGLHGVCVLVQSDHRKQENELMEEKPRLTWQWLTVGRLRVHIHLVDLDQHSLLNQILILLIGHRSDALSDQLVQRLDIQRVRDQLLQTAHLEESTDLHLCVLILDISLPQNLQFVRFRHSVGGKLLTILPLFMF